MLRVEGLEVYYDNIRAIKGVDFHVNEGEIVTLIGANGAGKSTILKTISGLLRPAKGDILLHGKSLVGVKPHKMVKLGLAHCPEGRRCFLQMTVAENLEMGAFTRDKTEISEGLATVYAHFPRLAERHWQLAGSLSGGEQQMLAMARAVMLNPEVILLDEPSMGLAPILVEEVFRIITRLKAEGVTMLLVEQFAAAALNVADYGYVLENGSISVHGPAESLKTDPKVIAAYLGGGH